jgi:hypothetical protein
MDMYVWGSGEDCDGRRGGRTGWEEEEKEETVQERILEGRMARRGEPGRGTNLVKATWIEIALPPTTIAITYFQGGHVIAVVSIALAAGLTTEEVIYVGESCVGLAQHFGACNRVPERLEYLATG